MRSIVYARSAALVLCAALLIALIPSVQARPADGSSAPSAAPPAPPAQTTADTFVADGVNSFSIWGKRLVWHQPAYCPGTPPGVTSDTTAQSAPLAAADPERINRLPTYGGFRRTIYARNDPRESGVCNPYRIYSNVVTDESYVYWMDATGLVRISVEAGPADTPELLNGGVGGTDAGMIAIAGDNIVGYRGRSLFRTPKNAPDPGVSLGTSGATITNLQVADGNMYYIIGGTLYRRAIDGSAVLPIASSATGYYPDGARLVCTPTFVCRSTNYLYVAQGRSVRIFNNTTNQFLSTTYTSTDAQATVYRMISSGLNLFIFETRFIPCSPSPCFGGTYNDVLVRTTRTFGSPVPIYVRTSRDYSIAAESMLASDDTFLFWKEAPNLIRRLPNDAAALSMVDMVATRIEITQGVQRTDNSVLLVQRRRTFVRVFVRSASTVNGVTMSLSGSWSAGGQGGGTLQPVNSVGKLLTVQAVPDPNNIDHAFLFELPWEWTTKADLQLQAELNPNHFPLEPNYANNVANAGPFSFRPSPRLAVQYIMFGFELNNVTYYPRLVQDLIVNYSYLRRTYPLASTPGTIGDPTPGFRPNVWLMFDDGLADRILPTSGMIRAPECSREPFLYRDKAGNITTDNRNLCASAYINSRLKQIRAEEGLDSSIFMYGMISDSAGFPRGQEGGDRVSSGPAGPGWEGYYAAHEVGHSLERAHPNAGSDDPTTAASEGCGHSRSDPGYPYASTTRAPIGPTDGSVSGFDAGDPEVGAARAIMPSSIFNDYMSYCSPYWISDYTYSGMYNYMLANPSKLASAPSIAPQQSDGWLSVFGVLGANGRSAVIHEISRRSEIGTVPPRTDGPYAIQLLGGGGRSLAEYAFQPEGVEDGTSILSFGEVVPWVNSARTVRIIHRASGKVLAEYAVSATAPTISNIRLENATEPVTGTATLRWTAADGDGDGLSYDVFWSHDDGATYQPIRLDRAAQRIQIDTTQLSGGSGIFKVVASDGFLTTSATSAPIMLANKPPTVRITSPGLDSSVEWQQIVNFSADVNDLQDATLPAASLVWRDGSGAILGTGPLLSKDDLPVGTNRIMLTATNSAGQSGSDTVIVRVGDDLEYPTPTLSVSPTSVGWTSPRGSSTPLQAALAVSNVGGGSLSWTASSDAPWLILDTTSGNAPATITLTADPTGMPASTIRRANVTITTTVNGATHTIVVPVTLARGSAAIGPPPPAAPNRTFAPLVRR